MKRLLWFLWVLGYGFKLIVVMLWLWLVTFYYYVNYGIDLTKDYMNIVRAIKVWVNRK